MAPHLDLLNLLLVGGVHLLQRLLQLLVSLQQRLPQLSGQVQIWLGGAEGERNMSSVRKKPEDAR